MFVMSCLTYFIASDAISAFQWDPETSSG